MAGPSCELDLPHLAAEQLEWNPATATSIESRSYCGLAARAQSLMDGTKQRAAHAKTCATGPLCCWSPRGADCRRGACPYQLETKTKCGPWRIAASLGGAAIARGQIRRDWQQA